MLRLHVQPGETELTRIDRPARSWAELRVSPSSADFVTG